jgi:hypothetical protein
MTVKPARIAHGHRARVATEKKVENELRGKQASSAQPVFGVRENPRPGEEASTG